MIAVTFVAGLIPVVGNLVSNVVVVIVSLSVSPFVALGSLVYLVAIHKLEYFLNARLVGTQIEARAWELLLAMLLMEAAFGVAGLIAAPIYYAYLKDELSAAAGSRAASRVARGSPHEVGGYRKYFETGPHSLPRMRHSRTAFGRGVLDRDVVEPADVEVERRLDPRRRQVDLAAAANPELVLAGHHRDDPALAVAKAGAGAELAAGALGMRLLGLGVGRHGQGRRPPTRPARGRRRSRRRARFASERRANSSAQP